MRLPQICAQKMYRVFSYDRLSLMLQFINCDHLCLFQLALTTHNTLLGLPNKSWSFEAVNIRLGMWKHRRDIPTIL